MMITRQRSQQDSRNEFTSSIRSENLEYTFHSTVNPNTAERTEEITIRRSTTQIDQNAPPVCGPIIPHLPMADFAADAFDENTTRVHTEVTSVYQKAWEDEYEVKAERRRTEVERRKIKTERQARRSDFLLRVLVAITLLCLFAAWIFALSMPLQHEANGTSVPKQTIYERKVTEVQNELKGIEQSEGRQASIAAARRMRDETEDESVTDACDSWIREKKAAA